MSLYSEKIGQFVQKREQANKGIDAGGASNKPASRGRSNVPTKPLRRSQRLVEKETQKETARAEHISLHKGAEPEKGDSKKKGANGELKPRRRPQRSPTQRRPTTRQPVPDGVGARDESSNRGPGAQDKGRAEPKRIQLPIAVADQRGGHHPQNETLQSASAIPTTRPLQRTYSRLEGREREGTPHRNYPLPQLVPQKRPVKDITDDSSDDAGHLYGHGRAKRVVNEEHAPLKKRREQRLPLPPPPEIPILSTSSEE